MTRGPSNGTLKHTDAGTAPGRANGPSGPGGRRVAGVHARGASLRVVVLDPAATAGDGGRVVAAESFDAGVTQALKLFLARHQVVEIVRVAPAAECLARGESITRGAAGEMSGAMGLLAEATLPPDLPEHRRAVGVIPSAARDTGGETPVLVTAWVRRDAHIAPLLDPDSEVVERWTTPVVALAALRGPGAAAAWVDADDGSITMLAGERGKPAARVVLEDPNEPDWNASVLEAIDDTCQTELPEFMSTSGALRLAPRSVEALRSRITGADAASPVWLDRFGLALGAALVATSREALTRPLAMLSAQEATRAEPTLVRAARRASRPATARWLIVGAAALAFAGPLSLAWARVKILDTKLAAAASQRESMARVEREALLYQQMERVRWPMSKLIADLARATPQDVVVSSLVLGTDRGVTMSGLAGSLGVVNELQRRLTETRLFSAVRTERTEAQSDGKIEFELSAQVLSPHGTVAKAEDYAAQPLSVRLFGERGSNTIYKTEEDWILSGGGGGSTGGSGASSRREERRPSSGDGEAPSSASNSRRPSGDGAGASAAGEPPKPLSDEEIAKMDQATYLKEFPARRKYIQTNPNIDPAVKARLEQEISKMQEARKKARGGS